MRCVISQLQKHQGNFDIDVDRVSDIKSSLYVSLFRYCRVSRDRINIDQPHLIGMYNKHMGYVDCMDQHIANYEVSIRGKKWYWPLFRHMIDMTVVNAWQLYRMANNGSDCLNLLRFRRDIALHILGMFGKGPQPGRSTMAITPATVIDTKDHVLEKIGNGKRLRCRHCHELSTTRCKKCLITLHMKCFEDFHKK